MSLGREDGGRENGGREDDGREDDARHGAPSVELDPPAGLLEVAETLEGRGYEAWAVGGAVRDELTGRAGADWDLATDARPEDVRRIFRRTVPIGVEHGTVGVLASDDVLYEVTTFRHDVETDGRHATVRFSDSIDEDLARRDFTINAVAWRPATGELRDPHGGREDLQNRVLRAVGGPAVRFREDRLRVLRGLRFAGRYRMRIEGETRRALREAVGALEDLSAERVREELAKILTDPTPSEALRLYGEFGVWEGWYRELARRASEDPSWEVNLAAVDAIARCRPILRLVRLLVPVGEDAQERVERGEAILSRLKFSNADTKRVLHLLGHHEPLPGPMDSDAELRSWLARTGEEHVRDVLRLHAAWARAARATEGARILVHLWRRLHGQLLAHPPLELGDLAVDGSDLLELGVREGPYVGLLLEELHARVLEDPDLNEREELLALAGELIEMGYLRGPAREEVPGSPEAEGLPSP